MKVWSLGGSAEDLVKRGNQQSDTQVPVSDLGSGNGWSLFLGVLELILVIGLVAVVVYLFIKFLAVRSNFGRNHPLMQTLSVHPLAANRTIQMISLEDRIYVVGVGDDVTLLDVITDKETVERVRIQSPVLAARELPEWMTKWLPMQAKLAEEEAAAPFYETLQLKLQQMKDQRKKIQEWDMDKK